MKLTLGFSPCPNDTFIFDALVNNKIDTAGLEFEVVLDDVQTLNEWATSGRLDITKLSYGVLPLVLDTYIVLNSGSALGRGVGPLLIKKGHATEVLPSANDAANPGSFTVAIPGENTTAHLLFSLAYPAAKNKLFLRYDKIEDFVLQGKGLGVIIHENRFTYQDKGLQKITDLGDYWEQETGNPIPLGGIVIKRGLDAVVQKKVDMLIRQSIAYAYKNYPELNDYIRKHSQEMSEDVMRQHIDLYVNDYSLSLGDEGRKAVHKLLDVYDGMNPGKKYTGDIFLES
ncbi:MAG: 1,4-dihydroxy-6-naphthoate synthase [Ferruginibacter sp.]